MALQFFTVLILLGSTLFAQVFKSIPPSECTEIRLDKKPEVMAEVPIQDQDGTLLCAAYASSQLIDAWRAKNQRPLKHITSPIALGVEFAAKNNKKNLSLLSAPHILETANDYNSCSYDVINDQFNGKKPAEFLFEVHNYFEMYQRNPGSKSQTIQGIHNCYLKYGFSQKAQISAEQIESKLIEDTAVKFNHSLFSDICKNHSIKIENIPKPQSVTSMGIKHLVNGMNEFRNIINKNMEKNRQPVGVSYCREVLNKPTLRSISDDGKFTVNSSAPNEIRNIYHQSPKGCSAEPHTSVIVGRRLIKYKDDQNRDAFACQYLVRDSYGTSCNDYPPDNSATPSDRCEKGQVWVDEDALLANSSGVYHL